MPDDAGQTRKGPDGPPARSRTTATVLRHTARPPHPVDRYRRRPWSPQQADHVVETRHVTHPSVLIRTLSAHELKERDAGALVGWCVPDTVTFAPMHLVVAEPAIALLVAPEP